MAEVAKVPIDIMNKILNVLGGMPYSQVAELIQEVRQNTQVVVEEDETPEGEAKE